MTWFIPLFKKELVEIKNDLRRPVFLFGAALAYLIVFGMLYIPNIVTAVPAVILDQENSAASRRLVQDFEASDSYDIKGYVTSEEEMRDWLREKTAVAAIEIPKDFSKKAKTGSYSTVLYLTNGSNIILTNITSSAAQDILADFSDHLRQSRRRCGTGSMKRPCSTASRRFMRICACSTMQRRATCSSSCSALRWSRSNRA